MSQGIRQGTLQGLRQGISQGIGPSTAGNGPGPSDPAFTPLSDTDFQALSLSPWGSTFGFQESTGGMVGSGSSPMTLTFAGTAPTYGTTQAGWTRRFISGSDGLAQRFFSTSGVPTGSLGIAMLTYGTYGQSGAAAHVIMGSCYTSAGNMFSLQTTANGHVGVNCSGTQVNGTVDYRDGQVHPFMIVYDPINSRVKLYSDREVVTGSFNVLGLPGGGLTPTIGWQQVITTLASAGVTGGYMAIATGSVASSMSDDGVASATLKKLGWNNVLF